MTHGTGFAGFASLGDGAPGRSAFGVSCGEGEAEGATGGAASFSRAFTSVLTIAAAVAVMLSEGLDSASLGAGATAATGLLAAVGSSLCTAPLSPAWLATASALSAMPAARSGWSPYFFAASPAFKYRSVFASSIVLSLRRTMADLRRNASATS